MSTILINADAQALINDINLSDLFAISYSKSPAGVGRFTLPLKSGGTVALSVYGENLPSGLFEWLLQPGSGTISKAEIESNEGSLLFSAQLPPGKNIQLANFAQAFSSGNTLAAVNLFLAGNDTVQSSIDVTIRPFPQIENIILLATASDAIGNRKKNRLTGNDLANTLVGNEGADTLTGKGGADTFALGARSSKLNASTRDIITDFSLSQGDVIEISRKLYKMPAGTSASLRAFGRTTFGDLLNGAGATSKQSFVYNRGTGTLYYNANGRAQGFGDTGGDLVQLLAVGGVIPGLSSDNVGSVLNLVA